MTKHHSLSFQSFIEGVEPGALQRYFQSLSAEVLPDGWALLNGDALEEFLSRSDNSELDALIRQDFRRLNDLAADGIVILLDAYERYSIDYDHSSAPQQLALLLFLDHPDAWDFAWSRYLLFALDSKVSIYSFPSAELSFGQERVGDFQSRIGAWLHSEAKGHQCETRCFELDGQRIIYVERGTHIRSITFWEDQEVQIKCFRPVVEDVLAFDSANGELLVKASQEQERSAYVRLFSHCFAGDISLAEQALASKTFDLAPVAAGAFNYQGEGLVLGVTLVGINLKLPFKKRASLYLNSSDIFETLKDLPDVSLDMGELAAARFRFRIAAGKRTKTVTFDVAPPARTDLPESTYTNLINGYLKKQGVRLR